MIKLHAYRLCTRPPGRKILLLIPISGVFEVGRRVQTVLKEVLKVNGLEVNLFLALED